MAEVHTYHVYTECVRKYDFSQSIQRCLLCPSHFLYKVKDKFTEKRHFFLYFFFISNKKMMQSFNRLYIQNELTLIYIFSQVIKIMVLIEYWPLGIRYSLLNKYCMFNFKQCITKTRPTNVDSFFLPQCSTSHLTKRVNEYILTRGSRIFSLGIWFGTSRAFA